MKILFKSILAVTMSVISIQAQAFVSEMKKIKLSDGEKTTARLCLPEKGQVNTLVVTIQGTGPYTYLTKRKRFNYNDVLAEGFCEKGVGYFTYNRRGVDLSDDPPHFDKVNKKKYAKALPHIEVEDIETMITFLKNDQRFKNCKIILYGISEGTIIASMVAERKKVQIDALFLHGYAHENMFDIIKWQNSGEGAMILINSLFDQDGDGVLERWEYEYNFNPPKGVSLKWESNSCNSDNLKIAAYRKYFFKDLPFDSVDVNEDGIIDATDIHALQARTMQGDVQERLMEKIAENDGDWIWNNYVRVTIAWLREHFALEPNKTRLLKIDIPIYIFHGKDDANVPAESVYDLEVRFKTCNKSNLKIFVFDYHNHDLNFQDWITEKEYSEGLQKLFDTAAEI